MDLHARAHNVLNSQFLSSSLDGHTVRALIVDLCAAARIVPAPPKKNQSKRTELMRWWRSLKCGDKVRVQQPWNDSKTPGGRVVRGIIGRKHPFGTMVRYRSQDGVWFSALCKHPNASPYLTVMPIDRDVEYDGKRGFFLRRAKAKP